MEVGDGIKCQILSAGWVNLRVIPELRGNTLESFPSARSLFPGRKKESFALARGADAAAGLEGPDLSSKVRYRTFP